MKILRIAGSVSPERSGITVTTIEAEEKGKTYHIQSEMGWVGERYVKKEKFGLALSVFRNEINDRGGIISFYAYCLPEDEKEGITIIRNKITEYVGDLFSNVKKMEKSFKKDFNTIKRKTAEDPRSIVEMTKLTGKILKTK